MDRQILRKGIMLFTTILLVLAFFQLTKLIFGISRDVENTSKRFELENEEMDFTIRKMKRMPRLFKDQKYYNQRIIPTPQSYFAFRLYQYPDNLQYQRAEFYYYNKKYEIGKTSRQDSLCIVSVGRNLEETNNRYILFLDSVNRQNYSNYRLIYVDDASDDQTIKKISQYLQDHPKLRERTKIIMNKDKKYPLKNKDIAIKQQCQENDIIIDLDADDQLVGSQALMVFNTVYQKYDNVWLLYANNVNYNEFYKQPLKGFSYPFQQKDVDDLLIRRNGFQIMHLRSFRREVYMKIPEQYFLQKNEKKNFHKFNSDGFIFYAVAELAGFNRIHFLNDIFYYYYRSNRYTNLQEKQKCSEQYKTERPFYPLKQINSRAQRVSAISDSQVQNVKKKNARIFNQMKSVEINENMKINYSFAINKQYQKRIEQIQATQFTNYDLHFSDQYQLSKPEFLKKLKFAEFLKNSKPFNKETNKLQYYYYDKKYELGKRIKQIPLCIIGYFENINYEKLQSLKNLIDSLVLQNYINYHIVVFVKSQNQRLSEQLKRYASQNYPGFKFLIKQDKKLQKQGIYITSPIDYLIQNFCGHNETVNILSEETFFIGTQSLSLLGYIFSKNEEIQMVYTNILYLKKIKQQITRSLNSAKKNIHSLSNVFFKKSFYDKNISVDGALLKEKINLMLENDKNLAIFHLPEFVISSRLIFSDEKTQKALVQN